jgi:SdpC family antimicrobial peptide
LRFVPTRDKRGSHEEDDPGLAGVGSSSGLWRSHPQRSSFSGRELYRGIMLGTGEVVSAVPEIEDLFHMKALAGDRATQERLVAAQDRLMGEIHRLDGEFFERFRRETQSGEHLRIEAAIGEAGGLTLRAALALEGRIDTIEAKASGTLMKQAVAADPAQLAEGQAALRRLLGGAAHGGQVDPDLPALVYAVYWAVYVAVVLDLAVVVNVAVVQAVAVAVSVATSTYVVWSSNYAIPGSPGTLTREMMVNAVAERLASAPRR